MKKTCGNCKFWRFKASDSEGNAFGICDRPDWMVSILSEEYMQRLGVEPQTARLIENSIRTDEKFGCIQFEKET